MKQQASQRRGMSLQRGRSVVHLRLSSMHACAAPVTANKWESKRSLLFSELKHFFPLFSIATQPRSMFNWFFHTLPQRESCWCLLWLSSSRLCNWIYGAPTAPRANARPKTLRWSWKLWGLNLCKFNIRFSLYLLWCACNGNNFARKKA